MAQRDEKGALIGEYPFITSVIAVRNEEGFIAETINAILRQNYPQDKSEVIVADGESTDRTAEVVSGIASKDPRVRLLSNTKRLSSAGRNLAFRNARGDIFLVIDGHCRIPDNELLKNVARAFEKSSAMCLARAQPIVHGDNSPKQKAIAAARSSWLGHSLRSEIYSSKEGFVDPTSSGAAYRRELIEKIGFYDERFDACEDLELNYRVRLAGLCAYTTPKISVGYVPRDSVLGLFKQQIRYGKGRFRFFKKHKTILHAEVLVPPAFFLGLLTWPLIFLVPSFLWLLIGAYSFYGLLVCAVSLQVAITSRINRFWMLPLAFVAMHLGLGLGFIAESLRPACPWRLFQGHRS